MEKKFNNKIALISVWNHNYGSLLQTYAIQKFLESQGFDNEIIQFKEKNKINLLRRMLNKTYFKSKFKIIKRKIIVKAKYPDIAKKLTVRFDAFESFKKHHLYFSEPITKRTELGNKIMQYGQVVLGSDQVLHPANLLMNYFTLSFVPESIKSIAYAPSFGVSEIPSSQIQKTAEYLKRINYLSVREESGKSIIKRLINKDVPVVCDPTLLIDKKYWIELKGDERFVNEKYIFCYFLGTNPTHRSLATRLKEKTGYRLITLPHLIELVKGDIDFADEQPFNVSPKEFVNIIANAEYVLTDSFHGSIFSILFKRNFIIFNRFSESSSYSTNSRITTLLKQLGLEDRHVTDSNHFEKTTNQSIDYSKVDNKLNAFKLSSFDYINKALNA